MNARLSPLRVLCFYPCLSSIFARIGPSRFLKAIKARHQRKEDGLTSPIVVKVFVKPDGSVSLKSFTRKLIGMRIMLYCEYMLRS